MKTLVKLSLATLLSVAACWGTAQTLSSIRGSDVSTVDQAPEIKNYQGSKPGGQALIQRTFAQQPPLIPHKVDGFDDITAEENTCLDCHIHKEVRGQKIPQIKESHLIKPVNADAPQVHRLRPSAAGGDRYAAGLWWILPRHSATVRTIEGCRLPP